MVVGAIATMSACTVAIIAAGWAADASIQTTRAKDRHATDRGR